MWMIPGWINVSIYASYNRDGKEKMTLEAFEKYYNMVNEHGHRYQIPYLNPTDPDYSVRYVEYMKMKEASPKLFQKIINWD